ncbi:MAG: polyribonucleotide nucleotidyltransferase [Candidatus Rokubacteria bacterium]|nr:polyribonucleotide nucleotidyltransferase [Candidatus Rokubacteria bacterium]
MAHTVHLDINGLDFSIETGAVAKQADGAVVVRLGDTVVLATCTASKSAKEGQDFFPLTVEYRERAYAGGRIPGGYFKREGAPVMKEVLTCRLIDRPIRPLFPKGFKNEVQVICFAISGDQENDPDVLAMNGASAALCLSGMPFGGPVGAVRVGMIDGAFVVNPTTSQLERSTMELVVAGTEDAVLMVEGGAREVPEEQMLEAIAFGHEHCRRLARKQAELVAQAGKPRWTFEPAAIDPELLARVRELVGGKLQAAFETHEKHARADAVNRVFDEVVQALGADETRTGAIQEAFHAVEKAEVRRLIVERGIRVDGRRVDEIRPIVIQVGYLPRAHGSSLFTRGETQALVSATLGTKDDEQKIEALEGEYFRHFMLHYNFPPFSVGEVRRIGSPSRRDIGHGALAERAVEAVMPPKEEFPYTIRVVSDILESNGSSSMATVCGASLALMDAGVPLKSPVAGIAMGLVKDGERFGILTDIMGTEDHYGDMDFKVAGTEKGVTALQMDIKIGGVSVEIMRTALGRARDARIFVLGKMREVIEKPRQELSPYAPRFVTIKIRTEKIREVIGPGGKVVRGIQDATGAKIDIEDDGRITVFSPDNESVQKALSMIQDITREVELDRIYLGKVKKIVEFGAFVEVIPNTEGLLHISQIAESRIRAVSDVLAEGDMVLVKVIEIDGNGKMRLSRKIALRDQPSWADREKLRNPAGAAEAAERARG